jgi:hypothetical protein
MPSASTSCHGDSNTGKRDVVELEQMYELLGWQYVRRVMLVLRVAVAIM